MTALAFTALLVLAVATVVVIAALMIWLLGVLIAGAVALVRLLWAAKPEAVRPHFH